MESATHPHSRSWSSTRLRERMRSLRLPRPELAALLALAAVLFLWALSKNGWANDYYSAAVRSMAGSWHDFLYGSFDAKGLMTVDKPPAALWVEALSVKVFGFNSLAILVPQALMGAASVGLLYDLTRRRWGRVAGTVAGLALALTPVFVAVSRHNNPDALLVLCSVGALWCFVRALEHGATKWLVCVGVCVGLGFEAKMGAAMMVVPGMALAWLWVAPRGRLVALRQLAWAGAAMFAVALAWPVLVWLTPAAGRPWISGTNDNSIWSLIWEYNGLGRLEGQTGGPGNLGAGGDFGGPTGLFRLLNESLGGQAGWLLGAALVGGLGIAALSRLRRTDPRTGWIIAVGGAFGITVVAFSFAGGIFHPYYTSLLAPFAAALVGATVGQVVASERGLGMGVEAEPPGTHDLHTAALIRILGAIAIAAGAIAELVVIDHSATDLDWLVAPLVVVSIATIVGLLFAETVAGRLGDRSRATRVRMSALACGIAILLIGPAIWSVETLGHPTSGTFPAGGPESAAIGGPGGVTGGPGGMAGARGATGGPPGFGGSEAGAMPGLGGEAGPPTFGGSGMEGEMPGFGAGAEGGKLPAMPGTGGRPSIGAGGMGVGGGPGGMFGGEDLSSVLAYTEAHGGGTIAVDSQSGAASSIIEEGAEVAGIGGFSGKESSVSAAWLEGRIDSGQIVWIYTSSLGGGIAGGPGGASGGGRGDPRTGSESEIDKVVGSCTEVPSSAYGSISSTTETNTFEGAAAGGTGGTLYRCGES